MLKSLADLELQTKTMCNFIAFLLEIASNLESPSVHRINELMWSAESVIAAAGKQCIASLLISKSQRIFLQCRMCIDVSEQFSQQEMKDASPSSPSSSALSSATFSLCDSFPTLGVPTPTPAASTPPASARELSCLPVSGLLP